MVLRIEIDDNNVPFIQLGKHQMRLDLEDLDETYKKRAREELKETPENVENALRTFKEYIAGEKNLYLPIDDDKVLIKFLRPFKFNAESAFKVTRRYYKYRLKYPKYTGNITPHNVKDVFDNEVLVFLPTRSATGSRIMIINAGKKWNPKKISIQDVFKGCMVAIEIAMMEPKTQVAGVHVIINMEGFSLSHLTQISPYFAKLILDWVQECAPVRLHGIHLINQSVLFDMAYSIFKPFIGERLRKKLNFHGSDKNSLCEKVSAEALPKSLGGTETTIDCPGHLMSEMLFHYEHIFEKHNSYGYHIEKTS